MGKYLLIESRDPFESTDVPVWWDVARDLAKNGSDVTLFLVQNGVLAARKSSHSKLLTDLVAAGVQVMADEFSLRERGIPAARVVAGVSAAPLDVVIDQLAEGRKVVWH